jgi:hypothetical protein
MPTSAPDPVVLHAIPGRVRLHLPGLSGPAWSQVETMLRQTAGVRSARANPWTGNVLVHFDPRATNPASLLASVRTVPRLSPTRPGARRPFRRAARRLARLLRAAGRRPAPLVSVTRLCLSLARAVLFGDGPRDLLACLPDLLFTRRFLGRLLGQPLAELARHVTAIITSALSGQVMGVLFACLKALGRAFAVLSPACA